ncbi:MAG: hypothetical protein Q8N05_17445, partial [Bacteroidota bacterium]|nr:hypothetical protein [Bacteroidota bacterium]
MNTKPTYYTACLNVYQLIKSIQLIMILLLLVVGRANSQQYIANDSCFYFEKSYPADIQSWTTSSGIVVRNNMIAGNYTAVLAPPSNDNCPGTSITSNGASLQGTVAGATGSYGANQCVGCSCTSPDDKD